MKTFTMGDPHGGLKAIIQVLKKAKFDFRKDRLIVLGDVADGWPDVFECFELLFTIKNLIYVRGNHDQWLKDWLKDGRIPNVWTMQGGKNTLSSYKNRSDEDKQRHLDFLKKTPCHYVDEKDRVFVHGGFDPSRRMDNQDKQYMMWDRSFWENRSKWEHRHPNGGNEVYVGHTSTTEYSWQPITVGDITFMDTGGGWEGVLSMMNIDSKELFQSDRLCDLYPGAQGR